MIRTWIAVFAIAGTMIPQATVPACRSEHGRRAERVQGTVKQGEWFQRATSAGWIMKLRPQPNGWSLEVTVKGREDEDLSRLTTPWHFVPNPRDIEGWHFRNADNTGPNDGSVDAPQRLREFIFSPAVGRGIDYQGSDTDISKVQAFGRGWLFIEKYALTPPSRRTKAAFESMAFYACLTWPANAPMDLTRR